MYGYTAVIVVDCDFGIIVNNSINMYVVYNQETDYPQITRF